MDFVTKAINKGSLAGSRADLNILGDIPLGLGLHQAGEGGLDAAANVVPMSQQQGCIGGEPQPVPALLQPPHHTSCPHCVLTRVGHIH